MIPMLRHLRKFLLLLPIFLLVIVVYSALRSYLPQHLFFRSHEGKLVLVFVPGDHVLWSDASSEKAMSTSEMISLCRRIALVQDRPHWKWAGIESVGINFMTDMPCLLMISYWYLAIPLAIASAWSIVMLRRLRLRERPGHCNKCGYDLRASNETCPECGATKPSSATARATPTAAIE
jgi:hypothetical protein